ncbi:MAG: hypothetical protein IIB61_04335 [Planctomycetes bacterium]|nr:hypothetical protein [Planctomycetota bacterium]
MLNAKMFVIGLVAGIVVHALGFAAALGAEKTEGGSDNFYRAYYLETAERDHAAAAELYAEVVNDRRAGAEVRADAKVHLAACREEIKSADLAALMPPHALAYVELNRPGGQLVRLLGQLGLLADDADPVEVGARKIAISRELVEAVLGIRGVAVAVTGFDAVKQQPHGVAVFHPGEVAVFRGLIETGLPIGGVSVDPIGGYATYSIEGQVYVTLTSRMVIVGTQKKLIADVIDRLGGKKNDSIATSEVWADAIADREDALLFLAINAKAVLPLVKGVAAAAGDAHELAIAQAIVDLDSIRSLSARIGVSDEGVSLNVKLSLDEGHRSLAYNFFRTPRIDEATLRAIPEGVAAFAVCALNESSSRYAGGKASTPEEAAMITALDFGRELFANIVGMAIYVLPPDGTDDTGGGMPIPDVALVFTVNDPSKSEALWTQVLGIAHLANGGKSMAGGAERIGGVDVATYVMEHGVTLHFASMGNEILISPSRSAVARSIAAKKSGRSILDDKELAGHARALASGSTKAFFGHIGRCAEIAKRFMPPRDLEKAAPLIEALSKTTVSIVVDYGESALNISAGVRGVPKIGGLLSAMLDAELGHGHRSAHAIRR